MLAPLPCKAEDINKFSDECSDKACANMCTLDCLVKSQQTVLVGTYFIYLVKALRRRE